MTIKGSCHCGATRFEIEVAPASVTACNCTFCAKTGALWAYYTPDQIRFRRQTPDAIYAPSLNKHHFCPICGIPTFGESPTWDIETRTPDMSKIQLGINARLFDDFDLSRIEHKTIDGRHLW